MMLDANQVRSGADAKDFAAVVAQKQVMTGVRLERNRWEETCCTERKRDALVAAVETQRERTSVVLSTRRGNRILGRLGGYE